MLIKRTRIPVLQIAFVGFLPGFIKKFYYRRRGYVIGKNVSIGLGSVIIAKDVKIGSYSSIGFFTIIRADEVLFDDHVSVESFCYFDTKKIKIGQDTRIREKVIIGGIQLSESKFEIGKRCIILSDTFINPTLPIKIGNDVGIGGNNKFFTHASWQSILEGYPVIFKPIEIHDNVWLAWNVFIMPGVVIGANSTIGAGSIVNINVPRNSLGTGIPFKVSVHGEGKWPRPIKKEKQDAIIRSIIDEFIKKVKNNNLEIKIDKDERSYLLLVDHKHTLLFLDSQNEKFPQKYEHLLDICVILNCNLKLNKKYKMVIDINNKTRIGSNAIGEEFLKFISHYGIRLNRKQQEN